MTPITRHRKKWVTHLQRSLALTTVFLFVSGEAASLVRFDFEQKLFTELGPEVKDHSLIREGSTYHLFYLRGAPAVDLGHATSDDLIHWNIEPTILPVQQGEWDEYAIWAPNVKRIEKVNRQGMGFWKKNNLVGDYIMYYTGVLSSLAQETGLATSTNLFDWTRGPWPVYHPDPSWALWSASSWPSNCRDPFVFEHDDTYYMLTTASTLDNKGAIACASSNDLYTWEDVGPLYVHSNWHVLESVQLLNHNGKYHLFFTEEEVLGTSHMTSDNLFSGWDISNRRVIDSGNAPEVNQFDDDRFVLSRHAAHNEPGNSFWVIRFDSLFWDDQDSTLAVVSSQWPLADDWIKISGNAFDHQPTFLNNPKARGLDVDVDFEGLFWLGTNEKYTGPMGVGIPGRAQGEGVTGIIHSKPFTIEGNSMSLLVGGGNDASDCYVALVDANTQQILFKETGRNTHEMDRRYWNLKPYEGRDVYIEICDMSTESFGHISCDDIIESYDIVPSQASGRKKLPNAQPVHQKDGRTQLHQNNPNPFNPTTAISYELSQSGHIAVDIFDVRGSRVRTLKNKKEPAGTYQLQWDGKGDGGNALSSGIYFYRLEVDGIVVARRKMVLLK